MAYSDLTHLSVNHCGNDMTYDNFVCTLLNETLLNSFKVLSKFIPIGLVDDESSFKMMAWHLYGAKPLPERMTILL